MKTAFIAGALALLCAAGAQASTEPKTREQVRQELADAIRNGDLVTGEGNLTLRERFPNRYPVARAQAKVQASADVQRPAMP